MQLNGRRPLGRAVGTSQNIHTAEALSAKRSPKTSRDRQRAEAGEVVQTDRLTLWLNEKK